MLNFPHEPQSRRGQHPSLGVDDRCGQCLCSGVLHMRQSQALRSRQSAGHGLVCGKQDTVTGQHHRLQYRHAVAAQTEGQFFVVRQLVNVLQGQSGLVRQDRADELEASQGLALL